MDDSLEQPTSEFKKPADDVDDDNDQSSDEEDGGLDWTKLLPAALRPVIPKRGEKEYEPRMAGGSNLQVHVLERSRAAMFETLKATRATSSKAIAYGIWHPRLARTEVTVMKGIHFSSMGHSVPRKVVDETGTERIQKQLELLPEEAMYLIERGAMFCWKESDVRAKGLDGAPMSVQQAYSEMMGKEGMSLERFQVFAYLKRLGYVVTRAQAPSEHYPLPPPWPAPSVSVFERIRRTFAGVAQGIIQVFKQLWSNWWSPLRIENCCCAETSSNSIFRSLRSIPHAYSTRSIQPLPIDPASPYKIFYNVWKPSTPFKKSSPPLPDFQIVVVNSRTTPMPTLQELTNLFDIVPEAPLPPPRSRRPETLPKTDNNPTPTPSPSNAPNATRSPTSLLKCLSPWVFTASKITTPERKVNPFAALKHGKKMVIIAVVDSGNIGFFRFSEGAFAEWPMV